MHEHVDPTQIEFHSGEKADQDTAIELAKELYSAFARTGFMNFIDYKKAHAELSNPAELPDLYPDQQLAINESMRAAIYERVRPSDGTKIQDRWPYDRKVAKLVLENMIMVDVGPHGDAAWLQNPFNGENIFPQLEEYPSDQDAA